MAATARTTEVEGKRRKLVEGSEDCVTKFTSFKLERYFAQWEFKAKYLLCSSDCESLTVREVLAMAGPVTRAKWEELTLGYTESQGAPELREAIAGLYKHVVPDEVLVCCPEEGIFLAMNALLAEGDSVVVMWPAYQSLFQVALDRKCSVRQVPVTRVGDSWAFDLAAVERACDESTKMVVVNFPHNPTGYLPSRAEQLELVELCRRRGLFLFSDEMYHQLFPEEVEYQLPSAVDLYEKAVVLFGMSKTFSCPGLRLGWVATRCSAAMEAMKTYKDYTTICPPGPSEVMALIVLENADSIVKRNKEIVAENLAALREFCRAHADTLLMLEPRGGCTAFIELRGWAQRLGAQSFCDRCVAESGVMLLPSPMFDFDGDYVRAGLGRRVFREGLEHLAAWLRGAATGAALAV